jgi:hypothetical protein
VTIAGVTQASNNLTLGLITPNADNTRGSALVTIVGFNMGQAGQAMVEFPNSGFSPCVVWVNEQKIIATVPAGYGTGNIIVHVGSYVSPKTSATTFSYYAPEVYTIFPLGRVPGESSSRITIRGRYFGWSDSKPTITLVTSSGTAYACDNDDTATSGGVTTTVRKGWVSDSEVYCRLSTADTVGAGRVIVSVGGLGSDQGSYPVWFSFSTPRGIVLPTSPTRLKATMADFNSFTASWSLPFNTGSSGTFAKIQTYRLQISSDTSFQLILEDQTLAGTILTYTTKGFVVGKLYYFRVAAMNDAGQGSWARTSSICMDKPSVPRNVVAWVSGARQITVDFRRPIDTGAGGLTVPLLSYYIRLSSLTGELQPVEKYIVYDATAERVTANLTGVQVGFTWNAQVAAINALTKSDFSAAFNVPSVDVASSVTFNAAVPANPDTIDVKWNAPSNTGFSDATFPLQAYEIAFSNITFSSDNVDALVAAGTAKLYTYSSALYSTQDSGTCTTALTPTQCSAWARYSKSDAFTAVADGYDYTPGQSNVYATDCDGPSVTGTGLASCAPNGCYIQGNAGLQSNSAQYKNTAFYNSDKNGSCSASNLCACAAAGPYTFTVPRYGVAPHACFCVASNGMAEYALRMQHHSRPYHNRGGRPRVYKDRSVHDRHRHHSQGRELSRQRLLDRCRLRQFGRYECNPHDRELRRDRKTRRQRSGHVQRVQ